MKRGGVAVLALGMAVASGCAGRVEPAGGDEPFRVVATVRQVMDAITIPASDVVWAAGSEAPEDEAQWRSIENGALALAESGNLLLMPGRAVDRGEWATQARAMIDAANAAAEAARARDLDRLLDAGDAIYLTCDGCHAVYMGR